jgi:hypothetical protein
MSLPQIQIIPRDAFLPAGEDATDRKVLRT